MKILELILGQEMIIISFKEDLLLFLAGSSVGAVYLIPIRNEWFENVLPFYKE